MQFEVIRGHVLIYWKDELEVLTAIGLLGLLGSEQGFRGYLETSGYRLCLLQDSQSSRGTVMDKSGVL